MALICPRCNPTGLEEIDFKEVTLDRCPRCGGLWFDNAEVAAIADLKSEQFNLESIIPSSENAVASMICPRCDGVELRKLTIKGKIRAQVVYRCISCLGTWLDRGELREAEDPGLKDAITAYFSNLTGNDEP